MRIRRLVCGSTLCALVLVSLGCVAAIGNRSGSPKTSVSAESTGGQYRIETVRLDDGSWALLKYRPDTGAAWYTVGPDNTEWIRVQEADDVDGSHYVFEPRTTGGPGWTIVRLDTRSGRTWITRNSVWVEVEDLPDSDS